MVANTNRESSMPTPEEVDEALRAFWRGSPEAFDRLVNEGEADGPGICALLARIIDPAAGEPPVSGQAPTE